MALETRKVLVQAIFDKVSRLSVRSLSGAANSSRLINTVISEVLNLEHHLSVAPFCLAAPLINVACYAIIWHISGFVCAVKVLAIWLLLVVVMVCFSKKTKEAQQSQACENTERMKLINEMIMGIQTIKAYTLEHTYAGQVIKQRGLHESKVLRQNLLSNLNFTVFQNIGLVAVLCIFLPLWFNGERIDLGDGFTLLALIYYLFFSVNSTTLFSFNNAARFLATVARTSEILSLEELAPKNNAEVDPGCPIVQIADGEYSWGSRATKTS